MFLTLPCSGETGAVSGCNGSGVDICRTAQGRLGGHRDVLVLKGLMAVQTFHKVLICHRHSSCFCGRWVVSEAHARRHHGLEDEIDTCKVTVTTQRLVACGLRSVPRRQGDYARAPSQMARVMSIIDNAPRQASAIRQAARSRSVGLFSWQPADHVWPVRGDAQVPEPPRT